MNSESPEKVQAEPPPKEGIFQYSAKGWEFIQERREANEPAWWMLNVFGDPKLVFVARSLHPMEARERILRSAGQDPEDPQLLWLSLLELDDQVELDQKFGKTDEVVHLKPSSSDRWEE